MRISIRYLVPLACLCLMGGLGCSKNIDLRQNQTVPFDPTKDKDPIVVGRDEATGKDEKPMPKWKGDTAPGKPAPSK